MPGRPRTRIARRLAAAMAHELRHGDENGFYPGSRGVVPGRVPPRDARPEPAPQHEGAKRGAS
jgi:hypothetical protein